MTNIERGNYVFKSSVFKSGVFQSCDKRISIMTRSPAALTFAWTPYRHQPSVILSECDPNAKVVARWVIRQLLADIKIPCHIEHIGSSALGVAGKGIIDIALYYRIGEAHAENTMAIAQKLRWIAPIEQKLQAVGWQYDAKQSQFPAHRPRYDIGVNMGHALQKPHSQNNYSQNNYSQMHSPQISTDSTVSTYFSVYCHLLPYAGIEMQKQRCFRQRLLQSPALQLKYRHIKQAILDDGVCDPLYYGKRKGIFIKRVLQESGY